ncbi:MAG: tRNA (adenosine(37)-N6)-threonylcarbamoyltransferase complex ATPase subunit type 1 TsaE [Solirubrobacteraceae bacterium]
MPRRFEIGGRHGTSGRFKTGARHGTSGHFETTGAPETEALGAGLAATLSAGEVVLVEGELGAGKTTFVRGACRALGVRGLVTSPTFTIGQRYRAPVPVSHLDLFRVPGLVGEDPDLLADYLGPDTITFAEWPQGAEELLAGLARIAVRVRLEHGGGDRRLVQIAPSDVAGA